MKYDYVLRYHAVVPEGHPVRNIWEVSYRTFILHMNYIRKNSLRVWITFDDGIKFPVLKRLPYDVALHIGQRVTVFVLSDLIGKRASRAHRSLVARHQEYLSVMELTNLKSAGVEIGSHGTNHADFNTLSDSQLWNDIYGSRVTLEHLFGGTVKTICYPSGVYNGKIQDVVRRSGYTQAVACEDGDGTDFAISRMGMYEKSFEECVKEFVGGERAKRRVEFN